MEHNLETEEWLLDLLGYSKVQTKKNQWTIFDENGTNVGYIIYDRAISDRKKKGEAAVYCYYTHIKSSTVNYDASRRVNDKQGNFLPQENSYTIFLNGEGEKCRPLYRETSGFLEINRGKNPYIKLQHDRYPDRIVRDSDFNAEVEIDDGKLFVFVGSTTEHFATEEELTFANPKDGEAIYSYQIASSDINWDPFFAPVHFETVRSISGRKKKNSALEIDIETKSRDIITLKEIPRFSRFIKDDNATIEDIARENEMGQICLKHAIALFNKRLPFKKDLLSLLITEEVIKDNNLEVFFQIPEKEKTIN